MPARAFPWTQDEVRYHVDYNPKTGVFTRNGQETGAKRPDGRWQVSIQGTVWLRSRLAYFWMTGKQIPKHLSIDHINRNRADDRWENLRVATRSEQQINRGCVEYKGGYWWCEDIKRWQVRCKIRDTMAASKTLSFGEYTSEERAKVAGELMKAEMTDRLGKDVVN